MELATIDSITSTEGESGTQSSLFTGGRCGKEVWKLKTDCPATWAD